MSNEIIFFYIYEKTWNTFSSLEFWKKKLHKKPVYPVLQSQDTLLNCSVSEICIVVKLQFPRPLQSLHRTMTISSGEASTPWSSIAVILKIEMNKIVKIYTKIHWLCLVMYLSNEGIFFEIITWYFSLFGLVHLVSNVQMYQINTVLTWNQLINTHIILLLKRGGGI